MLASAAGEFATALNMLGTTPKAPLIRSSVGLTVAEDEAGSTRLTCAMMIYPSLMLGGGYSGGPAMAVAGPLSLCTLIDQRYLAGATLPGSDRVPEATLWMLVTHSSGACRLALTRSPAVTPSKDAVAIAPIFSSGM